MINFAFTLIVLFWNKNKITIGTIVTMVLISLLLIGLVPLQLLWTLSALFQKYITLICGNLFVGAGIGLTSLQTFVQRLKSFRFNGCREEKWTFRRTEISLAFYFNVKLLLDGPIYFGTIILSFTTGWIIQAFIQVGTQILNRKSLLSKLLNRLFLFMVRDTT